MPTTAQDIIIDALTELNVVSPGESVDAALINKGLTQLNRMIDSWTTERRMIYANVFKTFTFTPNHQPHTIGPSTSNPAPDWAFGGAEDTRPIRIAGANLILNTAAPQATVPIIVRDAAWWLAQQVKSLTSTYPTDLYYEPDLPNGSCYMWPIPSTAWQIELEIPTLLTQFTLATKFAMPPGYWDAVVWNLAVRLWPSMSEGEQLDPVIAQMAIDSKRVVKAANSRAPNISTGGDGLPSGGAPRPNFNWRTGFTVGR